MHAITDKGELLWHACHDVKKHGYHSSEAYPFDAIKEALKAWDLRKKVRAEWSEIIVVRKASISGRTAALLVKVEPQKGFVIYQALQREAALQPVDTANYETANAIGL